MHHHVTTLLITSLVLYLHLLISLLSLPVSSRPCPCSDSELCQIINTNNTKEVFMFSTRGTNFSEYELFDWTKITTLALAKYTDDRIMCYAHSKRTRIVLMVSYPGAMLTYSKTRNAWVTMVIQAVIHGFLDGVHLDFEDFIEPADEAKRAALIDLFSKLAHGLKVHNPDMQVTIDFSSDPTTPRHVYGYTELMKVADFAFLRTYDERRWVSQSQPCTAWATDANNVTLQGLKRFENLGITADKLILGFGWYGFDYECTNNPLEDDGRCTVARVHGRCTCGSAGTHEYAVIIETLVPRAVGGVHRDKVSGAPYINYKIEWAGPWRQVWYNDPESLRSRYALADKYSLRGVGAWVMKDLDYSHTPRAYRLRQQMFDTLPQWKAP